MVRLVNKLIGESCPWVDTWCGLVSLARLFSKASIKPFYTQLPVFKGLRFIIIHHNWSWIDWTCKCTCNSCKQQIYYIYEDMVSQMNLTPLQYRNIILIWQAAEGCWIKPLVLCYLAENLALTIISRQSIHSYINIKEGYGSVLHSRKPECLKSNTTILQHLGWNILNTIIF